MAEFSEAFTQTAAHEGGYSNDPLDRGGETYRGIARVHHPDWALLVHLELVDDSLTSGE